MSRVKRPKERKEEILKAALSLAVEVGYQNIRRDAVAEKAKCATGTVNLHYNTLVQLKRAVMRRAIKDRNDVVIMQGILAKDPESLKLSNEVKTEVCSTLINS